MGQFMTLQSDKGYYFTDNNQGRKCTPSCYMTDKGLGFPGGSTLRHALHSSLVADDVIPSGCVPTVGSVLRPCSRLTLLRAGGEPGDDPQ